MISPLNFEQAVSARDALAKAVYGRTFNWLVEKINQSLTLKVQEQLQKLGRCAAGLLVCFNTDVCFAGGNLPQQQRRLDHWAS